MTPLLTTAEVAARLRSYGVRFTAPQRLMPAQ